MNKVEQKLSAARTRLILDKPFLGALVLRLPLIEATGSWCTSSATDARSLYYNADYMASLSLSQVQFVLAHEALHCGLSHFARRNHRDLNRWNIACDHAVNLLLVEDGLELAPGALLDDTYKGLAAEEIYPLIEKDSAEETLDQHLYDNTENTDPEQPQDNTPSPDQQQDQNQDRKPNQTDNQQKDNRHEPQDSTTKQTSQQPNPATGKELNQGSQQAPEPRPEPASGTNTGTQRNNESGDEADPAKVEQANRAKDQPPIHNGSTRQRPQHLSTQERERLNTQWQQRLAGAAQQASQAGKMKGSVARLVERLLRSTVPWRTVLARYMSGSSRQDYNITRPSQRREGDAILPSLHSRQTRMLIALDTSGSIEDEELTEFIAEVNAIKSLVNASIILLACDAELDTNGPWIFEPWDQLVLPATLKGGGGTDFTPVFDWIACNNNPLDLIVYFTDARGRFPQLQPAVETLWLVKGGASVPWGQRIQLN